MHKLMELGRAHAHTYVHAHAQLYTHTNTNWQLPGCSWSVTPLHSYSEELENHTTLNVYTQVAQPCHMYRMYPCMHACTYTYICICLLPIAMPPYSPVIVTQGPTKCWYSTYMYMHVPDCNITCTFLWLKHHCVPFRCRYYMCMFLIKYMCMCFSMYVHVHTYAYNVQRPWGE